MDGDWADTPAGLALADGSLVVFTGDGRIQALDAADGAHRWCADGGLVTGVSDRLFTIRNGATVELDAVSGRATTVDLTVLTDLLEAAADPIAVGGESMPQRGDGILQGRALTATDRASGALLWERDVPGYQVVTTADLVIVNDQTNGEFLLSGAAFDPSTLAAYDIATGRPAWTRELPHYDALYLAGPDRAIVQHWREGTVRLVDTTDGTTVWEVPHDNPGRSRLYSDRGILTAVAADPATDTIYLLLVSNRPYRD
jgi:outer membrane protein assembly factor BamB